MEEEKGGRGGGGGVLYIDRLASAALSLAVGVIENKLGANLSRRVTVMRHRQKFVCASCDCAAAA